MAYVVPSSYVNTTTVTTTTNATNTTGAVAGSFDPASMFFTLLSNPLVVALIIVVVVFFGAIKLQQGAKGFTPKPLHEIFKEEVDELIKLLGVKVEARLWRGFVPVGTIMSMTEYKKIDNQGDIDEIKTYNETATDEKQKPVPLPFDNEYFIMKVREDGILGLLNSYFGLGIRFIVGEKKFFSKSNGHYFIDENQQPRRFGKMWIIGKNEYAMMSDFAWSFAAHDLLEQIINYSKKVSYLSPAHSQDIEKLRAAAQVEKEKKRGVTEERWG